MLKELIPLARREVLQPIHGEMTYRVSQQLAELFAGNESNTLGGLAPPRDWATPARPLVTLG